MSDANLRVERHLELWKERDKQISRWAFLAAVFAVVVLYKVLAPYSGLARSLASTQGDLAAAEGSLKKIGGELEGLKRLATRLAAVRDVLEARPWEQRKQELIERFSRLRDDYEKAQRGGIDGARDPARGPPRSAATAQNAPAVEAVPSNIYFGFDRAALARASSPDEFTRLLRAQAERQGQEMADETIRTIVKSVNEKVVEPIEKALAESAADAKPPDPALEQGLGRLKDAIRTWEAERLGKTKWYATVETKGDEMELFTGSLREKHAAFLDVVRAETSQLDALKTTKEEERKASAEQVSKSQEMQRSLSAKMQSFLAAWLRDIVTAEEMLQLYPFVLVGIFIVLAVKLVVLRGNYRVIREALYPGGEARTDPALSSAWTLVRRGRSGTLCTLGLVVGGAALAHVLFARGYALALEGCARSPGAAAALEAGWLPTLRWLGPAVFLAGAIASVVLVATDRPVDPPRNRT